jgi:hypothetical protein
MQSIQYVTRDALGKYDITQPIVNFIKNEATLKFIPSKINNKRDTVQIYYKSTNTFICEVEIEILGKFSTKKDNSDIGVWEWAWSDISLKANNIHYSKELLLYGTKLDTSEEYYKKILIMSRGIIRDSVQLDIIISIARSFIKIPGNIIYPDTNLNGEKTFVTTYYLFIPNDDFRDFVSIITKI